jgi:serine/threonine-protein kinase
VLTASHAAGVVHRDLKLDNIFLIETPPGAPIHVKVLDWGVARILGEDDPMAGMIAGTLTYVAPEQIRADDLTPAADIYSLAVLAYQLLLGAPPFAHKSDLELIRMHMQAPAPRPSHLWAEIPAELEAMLLAMLSKAPEQRPSIDDVLQGLIVARRAVRPRRPTLLGRIRRMPMSPPIDVLGRSAPLLDLVDLINLAKQLVVTPRRLTATVVALGALTGGLATLFGG